jgi:hypothetical protein
MMQVRFPFKRQSAVEGHPWTLLLMPVCAIVWFLSLFVFELLFSNTSSDWKCPTPYTIA